MKYQFLAIFLLFSLTMSAQFRMVSNGTPSWSAVNDSTYTATITFAADQTGNSYLANQILADSFLVFTGIEQLYRVDTVISASFSGATLRVVRTTGAGAPSGQVMVFNPEGRQTIPQVPFGSIGSTALIQAAVDTWNARISAQAGAGSSTGPAVVYDTLTSGNVTAIIAYQGGDGVSILNPTAGRFVFVVQKDTHLHLLSVKGDNTTLNASQEIEVELDNSANAAPRRGVLQLYDANNNSVTNQFSTGTVHTQATAGAVVTYTVPGLNGFGATGFIIEVQ